MIRPPFSARTQRYARGRATGNFLDYLKIVRTRAGALDETTLRMSMNAMKTVYQGPGRVGGTSGGGVVIAGDETLDVQNTQVYVPFTVDAQQDDVVLVLLDQSDDTNVNRAYRVMDTDAGGLLRSVRTLTCTGYHGSRFWSP